MSNDVATEAVYSDMPTLVPVSEDSLQHLSTEELIPRLADPEEVMRTQLKDFMRVLKKFAATHHITAEPFKSTAMFRPVMPSKVDENGKVVPNASADAAQTEERPLAEGLFVNLENLDEDDFDLKERALRHALDATGISAPRLAVQILPMRELGIELYDSFADNAKKLGYTYEDPNPKNPRPPAAVIITSCATIADISSIMPRSYGNGSIKGSKSVVRVNSEFPIFLWFRAINLMLIDSKVRLIPFPIVQEQHGPEKPIFQDNMLTFKGILANPREYLEWSELMQKAVANDGLEAGFAGAARYGYAVLLKRVHDEYEVNCMRVEARNKKIVEENEWRQRENEKFCVGLTPEQIATAPLKQMVDPLPLPEKVDYTNYQITPMDEEKWTTDFILMHDSGINGILLSQWSDIEFMEEREMEKQLQLYR
jgi:hypothetical protein